MTTGKNMEYVIVKSSRKGSNRTYTGTTWNKAGLGIPPEDTVYDDLEQAEKLAQKLSEHNPVGLVNCSQKSNVIY
jgi:hypothetical protein